MGYVYIGYYIDWKDEFVISDYVGMAKSKYTVIQFLKQFTVDDSIYEAKILLCDEEEGCGELNYIGIFPNDEYRICEYVTEHKNVVLLTPNLYMNWLDTAADILDIETWITTWDGPDKENSMYNKLFAVVDRGLIRSKQVSDTLKKTILLLFKDYQLKDLDPYGNNPSLDHIDLMIQMKYITPPK